MAGEISSSMPELPADYVKYSQVPKEGTYFTATTIPSGLLKEHNTKRGTYGVIRVIGAGQLQLDYVEPTHTTYIVTAEIPGIIEPLRKHQVKALTDDLEFCVEFYRAPPST